MRDFIKLVVAAFLSTIFLSTAYGIINLTPKSEQEPNIYYFGFTDTFVFTFIYTFPVYIVVGIIFSYLIDMMANKMQTTKVYVSKLAMYSLVGVIPALAFYFLFTGIKLDYRLLFYFFALGIFASNIFYHVLLLINRILNKQKT
ncbi:hypothetical protein H8R29_28475 (plasmid) [Priestia megaterium]|uniref:Putative membrane protein n=1 Tax=Priestia megaterium (strain ATCC 14581 / DSM 32 / CCUG 1817 / JCM 2506 / NBRC 15308 / NCIMB 9376 / NCTC 10342 / NRRL B-14308 / VKM B-512 / Ford 19) TaxID=1348623 RepID=A0A0B6AL12_PRIM2|nr:hypothetical protein [Priestia megaterium]AJI25575.1 putative membrane protein [Priestia megaterium NBRC 15308 = ATCC 14581]KFM95461.1 putative membrane protein [Priestia megaterium]KGJ81153.1 hypothetical protein BMT_18115 [Priestia megaterium NBRC 15308 = ATCC 14581]MDR4229827.1 hypothetical protein [Priestia megaterium]MED3809738.1 hypothetical protein [Priestia megaterium]